MGVSNLDNPSYTYTNLGTYTVSAEITIGTEVNTFSETIIITSNPIANFVTDINECDDDNDGVLDALEMGCDQIVTITGTNGGVKAENTAPPGWTNSISSPESAPIVLLEDIKISSSKSSDII